MSYAVLKVSTINCLPELQVAINADVAITTLCESIRLDLPDQMSIEFQGAGPLSSVETTALDALLATFVCSPVGTESLFDTNFNDTVVTLGDMIEFDGTNFVPVPTGSVVEKDDTLVIQTKTINFEGDVTVVDDGTKATVTIAPALTNQGIVGKLIEFKFIESSDADDRWLSYATANSLNSNETTALIPWKCKLVALTYTGKQSSVNVDFEIYSIAWTDDSSPKSLDFTWQVRNARVARRATFSPDVVFEAGDKVLVYSRDQGTNPEEMVLTMYLEIIEDNSDDVSRTYSSNASIGGGGGSTS